LTPAPPTLHYAASNAAAAPEAGTAERAWAASMYFNSPQFLLFFAVIFLAYWSLPWRRVRATLLLVAGTYFGYATWQHLAGRQASRPSPRRNGCHWRPSG
jgi:hypothetical protein